MSAAAKPVRCLAELNIAIHSRVGSALAQLEMLLAATPFCAPLLELTRHDLQEALMAVNEAERIERHLTKMLAGPLRDSEWQL